MQRMKEEEGKISRIRKKGEEKERRKNAKGEEKGVK